MDEIENIWKKAHQNQSDTEFMNRQFVENAFKKKSISTSNKMKQTIYLAIVLTGLSFVMFSYNLFYYVSNFAMLACITVLAIQCLVMIYLLYKNMKELIAISQNTNDLHQLLIYKIKYYNKNFQTVIHFVALSVIFLTFTINLTIENSDAIFELRKILLLCVFYIFAYLMMFVLINFSYKVYIKQLENALYNLQENTFNSIDKELKKHKNIKRAIVIIAIIVVTFGIIVMYFKTAQI